MLVLRLLGQSPVGLVESPLSSSKCAVELVLYNGCYRSTCDLQYEYFRPVNDGLHSINGRSRISLLAWVFVCVCVGENVLSMEF